MGGKSITKRKKMY